jgi:RimJ/RimL family protein N-acetyltransferase
MGWGGSRMMPHDPLPRHAGIAVLRRLQVSDVAVFQAYRHDPRIARYQDWYGTRSDAEANDFLARMGAIELLQRGVCSQIGIAEPDQLALVGDIGLTLATDGRTAEIGFTLRPEAQGRGMATAAVREVIELVFERTEAERVEAIVDPLNVRSSRLLERVGMRLAGSRAGTFRNAPCIDHVYEISRYERDRRVASRS